MVTGGWGSGVTSSLTHVFTATCLLSYGGTTVLTDPKACPAPARSTWAAAARSPFPDRPMLCLIGWRPARRSNPERWIVAGPATRLAR